MRIRPTRTEARATSHHGYNYRGGPGSWLSDAGIVHRSAWGRSLGHLYVSGGSHAGHVDEDRRGSPPRWTPADRLQLFPIETLDPGASFAELLAVLNHDHVAIIVQDGRFFGLITRYDLLTHLRRSLP